jgi:hypothetical protein
MKQITDEFNKNKGNDNAEDNYSDKKEKLDNDLEDAERLYEDRKNALKRWEETYKLNEDEKK